MGITSSTPTTIGYGSFFFNTSNTGAFRTGQYIRAFSQGSPSQWVEGYAIVVTDSSISIGTQLNNGSGTYTDWAFTLSGAQGATGPASTVIGPTGPQGNVGSTGPQGPTGPTGPIATLYNITNNGTTAYNPIATDINNLIVMSSGSANTVTILSSTNFPIGSTLNIVQYGAGQTTINGSGVTIVSTGATSSAPKVRVQYGTASAMCVASNVWVVAGDII